MLLITSFFVISLVSVSVFVSSSLLPSALQHFWYAKQLQSIIKENINYKLLEYNFKPWNTEIYYNFSLPCFSQIIGVTKKVKKKI